MYAALANKANASERNVNKNKLFFKKKEKKLQEDESQLKKNVDKTFISKKLNQLHCSSLLKMVSHEIVIAIMIQCSSMN